MLREVSVNAQFDHKDTYISSATPVARVTSPTTCSGSELQLCSSPVSPARVVPDRVVSSVSDPVGQRAILLNLLRHSRLLAEALNRSHFFSSRLLINDKPLLTDRHRHSVLSIQY